MEGRSRRARPAAGTAAAARRSRRRTPPAWLSGWRERKVMELRAVYFEVLIESPAKALLSRARRREVPAQPLNASVIAPGQSRRALNAASLCVPLEGEQLLAHHDEIPEEQQPLRPGEPTSSMPDPQLRDQPGSASGA